MRLRSAAGCVLAAALVVGASGLVATRQGGTPSFALLRRPAAPLRLSSSSTGPGPCDCEAEGGGFGAEPRVERLSSAESLRRSYVTNVRGERVSMDALLGGGGGEHADGATPPTTLLVFLRHLGWPYCWSYARQVSGLPLPPGVRGPFFVSIGDPAKLGKFLEINLSFLSSDRVFVDGFEREVYAAVGFGTFTNPDDPERAREAAKKLRAPDLGGVGGWLRGIPEGVLQLGGTLVVRGDEILYRHVDAVPGDTPDLAEVLRVLEGAAKATASSGSGGGGTPEQ